MKKTNWAAGAFVVAATMSMGCAGADETTAGELPDDTLATDEAGADDAPEGRGAEAKAASVGAQMRGNCELTDDTGMMGCPG